MKTCQCILSRFDSPTWFCSWLLDEPAIWVASTLSVLGHCSFAWICLQDGSCAYLHNCSRWCRIRCISSVYLIHHDANCDDRKKIREPMVTMTIWDRRHRRYASVWISFGIFEAPVKAPSSFSELIKISIRWSLLKSCVCACGWQFCEIFPF